ncbi:hypothetical protein HF086_006350 [Spodoptera exigua]|uniref:Uncharacterized protein n=1 Tax=Spodoptera exigua TaxID=7107 RepID=A0A922MR30_SPOEX|nr:hypothetical protein HF086_006350 [Spodoptera exigua]
MNYQPITGDVQNEEIDPVVELVADVALPPLKASKVYAKIVGRDLRGPLNQPEIRMGRSASMFMSDSTNGLEKLEEFDSSQTITPGQTVNVIVSLIISPTAQPGLRDTITFTAYGTTGGDQISLSAYVYVANSAEPVDTFAPEIRHTFQGTCLGRTGAAIAAIVLGVLLAIALIVLLVFLIIWCVRKRKASRELPSYNTSRN